MRDEKYISLSKNSLMHTSRILSINVIKPSVAEDVLHLTSGCFQPNIASKDCGRWFTSIAKSCHEIGVHYVQQTARLPLINGARETFFLGRPIFTGCVCFGEGRLVYTQGDPLRFLFHVFSAPIDAGIILHEISSSHPKTWWLSTDSVTILPSKQRLGSFHDLCITTPAPPPPSLRLRITQAGATSEGQLYHSPMGQKLVSRRFQQGLRSHAMILLHKNLDYQSKHQEAEFLT